jgi:hypothetical protein
MMFLDPPTGLRNVPADASVPAAYRAACNVSIDGAGGGNIHQLNRRAD